MDHIEYADRTLWDCSRIVALHSIAPYLKEKTKIQELFPLPWDDDAPARSPEDIMSHIKTMEEYAKTL